MVYGHGRPAPVYAFNENGAFGNFQRPIHHIGLFEDAILRLIDKATGFRSQGDPDPFVLVIHALPAKFREGEYHKVLEPLEKSCHQQLLDGILQQEILRAGKPSHH